MPTIKILRPPWVDYTLSASLFYVFLLQFSCESCFRFSGRLRILRWIEFIFNGSKSHKRSDIHIMKRWTFALQRLRGEFDTHIYLLHKMLILKTIIQNSHVYKEKKNHGKSIFLRIFCRTICKFPVSVIP